MNNHKYCVSYTINVVYVMFCDKLVPHVTLCHSIQDVAAMYPDRVITIKGTIDSMAGGEAAISTILRECYEKEAQLAMVSLLPVCV